jgi:hypothetical protein
MTKKFNFGEGKYYFTVKSVPNNITIYRKNKEAAVAAYRRYVQLGKDCEWHGCWNGKQFTESSPPND